MDRAQLQATQRPIKERYRREPEGDLDFRGTLGVASGGEAPVGFRAIRLIFDLDADVTDEQVAALLRLTERYCVVYQTLAGGVPVSIAHTSGPSSLAGDAAGSPRGPLRRTLVAR